MFSQKFTERKIVCNFHGYDSPQLLKEIQYEFQNCDSNFGFDFSCEEIRDKWEKLTVVYEFLKKKHKMKSQWMHFQAMKEHYEDSVMETEVIPWTIIENSSKKRSNSMDEQNKNKKSKLIDQQFDERSLSPVDIKKEVISEMSSDNVTAIKKQKTENKKYRDVENALESETKSDISKNKEVFDIKTNKSMSVEVSSISPLEKHKNDDSKMKQNHESYQKKENGGTEISNMSLEKQQGSGKVTINITSNSTCKEDHTIPNNKTDHGENKDCSELLIPQTNEVDIIISESITDKDSSNVTINLPSITKKFSSNEYLPLKKRLRLNEDKLTPLKEIEDGFRGFTVMDQIEAQFCSQLKDCNQLREEKSKIMNNTINISNTWEMNYNHEESDDCSSSYCVLNESQQSDLLPEGEDDPLAVPSSNTDSFSPKPVSLQIDESNSPVKEVTYEFDDESDPKDYEDGYFNGDQYLLGNLKVEDNLIKESISNEMIETSIVDEPITEVEIRSFEQYQTPEETVQPSSENSESILPKRGSLIEEEHLLSTEKLSSTEKSVEFSNQTLSSLNECGEINIISTYNNPNMDNMEYQTNYFGSTVTHLKTEVNFKEFENDEKVECSGSFTDTLKENEADISLNSHKSSLSPRSSCNSSQCQAEKIYATENVKKEIKSIRLPVTCGGKLKEIFISPKELSKIAQIKPNSLKSLKKSSIISNREAVVLKNNCKNINFTSHIIKEADNTLIKNHDKKNYISIDAMNKITFMPPPPKVSSTTGLLNKNEESLDCPIRESDGNSIISESLMDDEHLSDELLDDVIDDFQVQSNQELKDIKNLIKENNFLQRETNTILRQILNKL